jgi:hypothetical protein
MNYNFINLDSMMANPEFASSQQIEEVGILGDYKFSPVLGDYQFKGVLGDYQFKPVEPEQIIDVIKSLYNLPPEKVQKIKRFLNILLIVGSLIAAAAGHPEVAKSLGETRKNITTGIDFYIENYDTIHSDISNAILSGKEAIGVLEEAIATGKVGPNGIKTLTLMSDNLLKLQEISNELDLIKEGKKDDSKLKELYSALTKNNDIIAGLGEDVAKSEIVDILKEKMKEKISELESEEPVVEKKVKKRRSKSKK